MQLIAIEANEKMILINFKMLSDFVSELYLFSAKTVFIQRNLSSLDF